MSCGTQRSPLPVFSCKERRRRCRPELLQYNSLIYFLRVHVLSVDTTAGNDYLTRHCICALSCPGGFFRRYVRFNSYERHAVLEWFSACRANGRPLASPMTGANIANGMVTNNFALKTSIQVCNRHCRHPRPRFSPFVVLLAMR